MQSYLMENICRTGIFVICAQALIHFRPNASYEKYLKMLMSAMILLQMFLPLSNLFTGDGDKSLAARVAWFQAQLAQSMEQVMENRAAGEALLEQMTLQEVQSRITASGGVIESGMDPAQTDMDHQIQQTEQSETIEQSDKTEKTDKVEKIEEIEEIKIGVKKGGMRDDG